MPSLDSATGWLNSPPLTAAELGGKVVLVDFWTYTCINWLRTLPYLRAWANKYKDHGLVVLGVHTPEFDFEHDLDNVRRAVKELGVDYPVAVDNDYGIWNAFDNHYWPALYFVDAQGQIRHHRFGEGGYQESEMILQQLLTDAGSSGGIGQELVSVDPTGVEAAADWASLRSPENYLAYQRTQNFASSDGAVVATRHVYAAPARLRLNHWALSGDWTVKAQAIVLNGVGGRIAYRFQARDLHLVMGPPAPGMPVRFQVRLDGQPPGAAHGTDVDGQGNGTVTEPRLYQLIRQPGPVPERTFAVTFLDPGVRPMPSPSARPAHRRRPPAAAAAQLPLRPSHLGGHHGPGGAGGLHARPNSLDRSEETRCDAAHDAPSSADSPRAKGGRPGPSIPGGVGSRLERRPERRLAGRLGPAFRGRCGRLVREFAG